MPARRERKTHLSTGKRRKDRRAVGGARPSLSIPVACSGGRLAKLYYSGHAANPPRAGRRLLARRSMGKSAG